MFFEISENIFPKSEFQVAGAVHSGLYKKNIVLAESELIPPHQSLARQLPPEGKPFQNPFRFYTARKNAGIWKAVYFCSSIADFITSRNFVCYGRATYRRLPRGGKLSRERLMRGDKSPLTYGLRSSRASHPQKECDSRTL